MSNVALRLSQTLFSCWFLLSCFIFRIIKSCCWRQPTQTPMLQVAFPSISRWYGSVLELQKYATIWKCSHKWAWEWLLFVCCQICLCLRSIADPLNPQVSKQDGSLSGVDLAIWSSLSLPNTLTNQGYSGLCSLDTTLVPCGFLSP